MPVSSSPPGLRFALLRVANLQTQPAAKVIPRENAGSSRLVPSRPVNGAPSLTLKKIKQGSALTIAPNSARHSCRNSLFVSLGPSPKEQQVLRSIAARCGSCRKTWALPS